jgi:hypothetical protein
MPKETPATPPRVRARQADPGDAMSALAAICKRLRYLTPEARRKTLKMLAIEFDEAIPCDIKPGGDVAP